MYTTFTLHVHYIPVSSLFSGVMPTNAAMRCFSGYASTLPSHASDPMPVGIRIAPVSVPSSSSSTTLLPWSLVFWRAEVRRSFFCAVSFFVATFFFGEVSRVIPSAAPPALGVWNSSEHACNEGEPNYSQPWVKLQMIRNKLISSVFRRVEPHPRCVCTPTAHLRRPVHAPA